LKSPRTKLSPLPKTPTPAVDDCVDIRDRILALQETVQKAESAMALSSSPQEATQKIETPPSSLHRERLVAFYKKHNPSKLASVDSTLESYKGREEEMFRKLEEKYVKGFPPAMGEGPTCFLEFDYSDGKAQGRVEVRLFQDRTPLACENFRALCTGEKGIGQSGKQLVFRNSRIHRIVPDFCVQGGDFTRGDGTGGESIYPPNSEHGDMWGKFKDELFMSHDRKGLLSMANNGKDRNGSQFFFTLKPVTFLDGKHVVFGEVTKGTDVIDEIGQLPTDSKQMPQQSVIISDCGEIRNGVDIRASQKSSAGCANTETTRPFGSVFGGASTLSSGSAPLSFGALSSAQPASGSGSSFGFGSVANATSSSSPAPFGQSSLQSFGFSSAGTTAATATATAFSSDKSSSAQVPSFSFSASLNTDSAFASQKFGETPATSGSLGLGTLASAISSSDRNQSLEIRDSYASGYSSDSESGDSTSYSSQSSDSDEDEDTFRSSTLPRPLLNTRDGINAQKGHDGEDKHLTKPFAGVNFVQAPNQEQNVEPANTAQLSSAAKKSDETLGLDALASAICSPEQSSLLKIRDIVKEDSDNEASSNA
jgi:cyclophilin family peptidyl-prolyl cis-trans isomerase